MRLSGKVALITGAGSGIGAGTAQVLASEGAKVIVNDLVMEKAAAVAEAIHAAGGEAIPVSCDVSTGAGAERCVAAAIDAFAGLDVVVNNVGIEVLGTLEDLGQEDWDRCMAINVRSIFLVSRSALPHLRRRHGGSIINMGSGVSIAAVRDKPAYVASKGAVLMLTKAMALDYAAENIRVNCVCPGVIDTPMVQEWIDSQPDPEAARLSYLANEPVGRFGTATEVGYAVAYLASNESRFVTGSALVIDGGFTAG